MSESKASSGGMRLIGWTIVWALIAYFVYGSLELALSVALFNVVLSVTLILCIIPVIGAPLYYILATSGMIPFVYSVTPLYPTWVTRWIFGLNMVGAAIIWMIVIIAVKGLLSE